MCITFIFIVVSTSSPYKVSQEVFQNISNGTVLSPGAKGVCVGCDIPPRPVSVGKFATSLGKIVKFS